MIKAKQTILAYQHLNSSVLKVYPHAFEKYLKKKYGYYVGVKNTSLIHDFVDKLDKNKYFIHTIDKMALRGRSVDEILINPITLRPMTGSSSASAINVFLNINDLAIATDGGGSVLGPAISLNLYGFISPSLCIKENKKISTDKIEFKVSTGIISKNLDLIYEVLNDMNILEQETMSNKILYLKSSNKEINIGCEIIKYDGLKNRSKLIKELNEYFDNYDFIIYYESRIDIDDLGDTIYGIQDNYQNQLKGNKGIIRVINMIGASAITVPSDEINSGFVIACKSKNYNHLFDIAKKIEYKKNELIQKYFDINFEEEF